MKRYTIKNLHGLRIVIVSVPSIHSLGLAVLVKIGSRYETLQNLGLAHFYEHLCFRGTRKYPAKKQLALAVDQIGADFNGATGKEDTSFHIKLAAEHWRLGLEILSELVVHPLLRQADIQAERPIVLEEIKMRHDQPQVVVFDRLLEMLFPNNPLGLPTAGNSKSVTSLRRPAFLTHRQNYLTRDNLVLVVSGKIIDRRGLKSSIEELFSPLPEKKTGPDFPSFKPSSSSAPVINLNPKTRDQFHLTLGWLGYRRKSKLRYAQALLDIILGSGMSSRLFQKIREDAGLAYAIGSDANIYDDTGLFAIYAGVDKRRTQEAVRLIWQELQTIANPQSVDPITSEELQKAKDYIRGKLVLRLEEP
jgi:predicted Zn-dependent peptidase